VLLASLSDLLARPPAADGGVTVVEPPDERSVGVFAFTAHHVVCAPVPPGWVRSVLPAGDLSAPLNPPFLTALAERTGRVVNNIDAVFLAPPLSGPGLALGAADDLTHARAERARAHRVGVRGWTVDGGMLTLGRGVAGRWEVSVEVDAAARGRGLGRALFRAARALVAEPVWAQVAPGNAASVRAVLAAGFQPVGAEALLVRRAT
jgi:GNAT superfamily N-acetyltransferase